MDDRYKRHNRGKYSLKVGSLTLFFSTVKDGILYANFVFKSSESYHLPAAIILYKLLPGIYDYTLNTTISPSGIPVSFIDFKIPYIFLTYKIFHIFLNIFIEPVFLHPSVI